jgi:hypothetical protein
MVEMFLTADMEWRRAERGERLGSPRRMEMKRMAVGVVDEGGEILKQFFPLPTWNLKGTIGDNGADYNHAFAIMTLNDATANGDYYQVPILWLAVRNQLTFKGPRKGDLLLNVSAIQWVSPTGR